MMMLDAQKGRITAYDVIGVRSERCEELVMSFRVKLDQLEDRAE